MGVLCRSIATCKGCVAATALEDGHVLHTSTQPTLPNSAQVLGGSSQHQGGRVDDRRMLLAATLQYFHLMESSTVTSVVVSLGISLHLLMVIAGVQTSKAPISMASVSHMEILVPGSTSGLLAVDLRVLIIPVLVFLVLPFHHLLVNTTSVRPATTTMQIGLECSSLMTLSGMAKIVGHPIPVSVPSTILPGSASSCLRQQLMTSRFVFAVMNPVLTRILQWNLSNSTFADEF